ncbi:hypothetical protein PBY51_006054 [Eleginops maclovinus]|uniref:Uncharacterized protein n=1 Tax=Eleginops maclovinus TaxID=56733 RepID=A0AAN7WWC5_ELEMC|nr:hypothetical protein PBY51_006054 [Eleginops maclovinus]
MKVAEGAWRPVTHVFEAAVKDLQLLPGESRLGFKLLQALRAMADCRQFKLIFNAVCRGGGGGGSDVNRCYRVCCK